MIYITRKEHFNAAHKLFNPAWSEEQNNTIFGKCANKNCGLRLVNSEKIFAVIA